MRLWSGLMATIGLVRSKADLNVHFVYRHQVNFQASKDNDHLILVPGSKPLVRDNEVVLCLATHVDDSLVGAVDETMFRWFRNRVSRDMKITHESSISKFVGLDITIQGDSPFVSAKTKIELLYAKWSELFTADDWKRSVNGTPFYLNKHPDDNCFLDTPVVTITGDEKPYVDKELRRQCWSWLCIGCVCMPSRRLWVSSIC